MLNTGDMCLLQQSDIRWASRWDTYLLMVDDQIHWFSIINSVMIVLFLSGMVAMIMFRVLRRDITKYNQLESGEDAQEETGWKLVSSHAITCHAFGMASSVFVDAAAVVCATLRRNAL